MTKCLSLSQVKKFPSRLRKLPLRVKKLPSRLKKLSYTFGVRNFSAPSLLWSKGVGDFCDFGGPRWYRRDATENTQPGSFFRRHYAGAHGLIWLRLGSLARDNRTCDLDTFVEVALPTIGKPFVLITTDGDASVPSDLRAETVAALTTHPLLVAWYSQNCDGSHPRIRPFPIGIDLHTPRGFVTPSKAAAFFQGLGRNAPPAQMRPLKVFCDLNLGPSKDRREAVAALRDCGHVEFAVSRVSQRAIWGRYAHYPLVLSTHGNGLDSHRTWELLYLGCIVVTKTSSLDPLYDGLPVAIVRDWRQVRDPESLKRWVSQFSPLAASEAVRKRLSPEAWLQPLRDELDSIVSPSSLAAPASFRR